MAKKKLAHDEVLLLIGKTLKELRVKAGYTSYEQFAWDNELNRVQYWRMEKGVNITMKSLLKVLDVHNQTLIDFFKLVYSE